MAAVALVNQHNMYRRATQDLMVFTGGLRSVVGDIGAGAQRRVSVHYAFPDIEITVTVCLMDQEARRFVDLGSIRANQVPRPRRGGQTIRIFKNGRFQYSGTSMAHFNEVHDRLGLQLDPGSVNSTLVTGSARISDLQSSGFDMGKLLDAMLLWDHNASWNPSTGSNGMKIRIPDLEGERGALLFKNGYVKFFARNENQLVRNMDTMAGMLDPVMDEDVF